MKAVFVFDHFGPYHFARVREVAKLPGWEVSGVELHPRSRTYGWEPLAARNGAFRKISLPTVELRGREERSALRPHLECVMEECKPDVVFVNGWGDFMSLETICWAKKQGVRVVVMSETRRADGVRSWWGEWVKSRIVSLCEAGLCGGESHRRYLGELGLSKDRVALGYNAVDNHFFGSIQNSKREIENGWAFGLKEEEPLGPYFLASNRFVVRKNVGRLIRAYARYCASRVKRGDGGGAWPLVLLGDGELLGELEALCVELGLRTEKELYSGSAGDAEAKSQAFYLKHKIPASSGLVVFAGFRQVAELRAFYTSAAAFIHPAMAEPWGLVINEAMACGLPVLSSKNVGAAEELVREGVNGFLFDPNDVDEIAALMNRVADMSPEERSAMGAEARMLIAKWGPERFAQGAEEAAKVAMAGALKSAGFFDRIMLEVLIRK